MKFDLNDVTFVIPVRLDSIFRLENVCVIIDFLLDNFDTNLIILEASYYNNGFLEEKLKNRGKYIFIEDKDPVFYRTKYINIMLDYIKTSIVANWDADVIVDPLQLIDSIQVIRNGNCDIAFPYDGICYDTSDIFRYLYMVNKKIKILQHNESKMKKIYMSGITGAVGGAVLALTDKYIESGKDNEQYYGWGLEDSERYYRWIKLGYKIYRSPGCLFHFSHPIGVNGDFISDYQRDKSLFILQKAMRLQ